ncbi:MAG: DUF1269 domain-containing protein [Anaerolineae bacterium]|jgi:uncharacterized membrane protein
MKTIAVMVIDKPEGSSLDYLHVTAEGKAKEIYKELGELAKKGTVNIESGTIVIKNEEGVVKLRKTTEMTAGRGAGRGAFWGLLVGVIFGGPIGGLLAGLGLGAILGSRATKGIDRDFMKTLGDRMMPGSAALFLLVDGDDKQTMEHLEAYEGPLHVTPLTGDVEEALDKASTREDVIEAIDFDKLG